MLLLKSAMNISYHEPTTRTWNISVKVDRLYLNRCSLLSVWRCLDDWFGGILCNKEGLLFPMTSYIFLHVFLFPAVCPLDNVQLSLLVKNLAVFATHNSQESWTPRSCVLQVVVLMLSGYMYDACNYTSCTETTLSIAVYQTHLYIHTSHSRTCNNYTVHFHNNFNNVYVWLKYMELQYKPGVECM